MLINKINDALYLAHYEVCVYINADSEKCRYISVTLVLYSFIIYLIAPI